MATHGNSLLQEIIIEATKEGGDVPRMLRLCLVLASKLNHEPLKLWARRELEGYPTDVDLPAFRLFRCQNRGYFMTIRFNGTLDIPLGVIPEAQRARFETVEIRQSISECADLASKSENGFSLQTPWPMEIAVKYASKAVSNGQCIKAWQEVSPAEMIGLLDRIKTMVLDFALEIERESPDVGEIAGSNSGISEEKVTQIYNTTINGPVQNYAAGGVSVTQNAGLVGEDLKTLLDSLRAAGIPDSDVEELSDSLVPELLESGGDVQRIKEWYGSVMLKYAVNTGTQLAHTAWDQVAGAITTYLGS